MDKVTLLPCPFCGTAPVMRKWHGGAPTKVMIHCLKDDCDVSPQVPGDTQVIAADRWNTRATPAPDSEKLREAAKRVQRRVGEWDALSEFASGGKFAATGEQLRHDAMTLVTAALGASL